ncbi:MAG: CPCC family cysteine-rich protein [Raoultibacter sp.]
MINKQTKYPCPCCGYLTLDKQPPGTFDICPVCYWEDDATQFEDPQMQGGANFVTLDQARENFKDFGACDRGCIEYVRRPLESEREQH